MFVKNFSCRRGLAVLLLGAVLGLLAPAADENPRRLTRAESFLGIHFDFHCNLSDKEIGKNTTRAMIEGIINQVHPDYLQIDCKGHPGISSYPTKVGNPASSFVGDPLRVWRQVTAERGVALFMHYSGVLDAEAVRQHPEWAAVGPNGKPNARATSVFGPYVDRLLIPQLKELAGVYGVDGVWVDGECWGTVPDYGEKAVALFREKTGITGPIPRKPGDPHWFEWIQFHRAAFRDYLAHYIAEVKKEYPAFQICSNWAFSDHMPEPVSVPVDFLSGDFSPNDSVNSARLAGRCLARQGKPWDLMAWSFARTGNMPQKTAVQLKREAAMVLALGGGFQAYFKQKRDGSIYDEQMAVMAEVAKFCRERQAVCHRAELVPQVALLYSTAAVNRLSPNVYSPRGVLGDLNGVLQALLESQYSVEVLSEHHLSGHMKEYPLIVIPDWEYLDPAFIKDVETHVDNGGRVLLVGPKVRALFPPGRINTPHQELNGGILGLFENPFGADYVKAPTAEKRERFQRPIRDRLFPNPMVEVTGSHDIDVTLARKDGKLLVNLVNTSGPHKTAPVIESIAPVGPLQVAIRAAQKPSKVTLQPAGKALDYKYEGGQIRLTLPSLEIHDIIVVE